MEDIVKRTWGKVFSINIVRYCSNCKTYFKCNGSCCSVKRLGTREWCFCSHCYSTSCLRGMSDIDRVNCDVYQNYVQK